MADSTQVKRILVWPTNPNDGQSFFHAVCKAVNEYGSVSVEVPGFTQEDVFLGQAEIKREFGLSPERLRKLRNNAELPPSFIARWGKRVEYNYTRRDIRAYLAKAK